MVAYISGGTPVVPLPLWPGATPGRTLSDHIDDKNDPHGTLKLAKQVRVVTFLPAHPEEYNDEDLVVVTSTGKLYKVLKPDGSDSADLEEIALDTGDPVSAALAGRDFDLSTSDGVTHALGTVIEALGGTPHA